MTIEQRAVALAQIIRDEFNKIYNGTKAVANSNQLGGKTLATVESDYTTAVSNAVTALVGGAPPASDTLKKLSDQIALIIGGGYATLTDVQNAITTLVGGAPGALDTLKELADALNDDANAFATLTNAIALKADITSVYDKTTADTTFKTIASYDAEIGNPDHDLVFEFTNGLL
jgi:hypothetical protein